MKHVAGFFTALMIMFVLSLPMGLVMMILINNSVTPWLDLRPITFVQAYALTWLVSLFLVPKVRTHDGC